MIFTVAAYVSILFYNMPYKLDVIAAGLTLLDVMLVAYLYFRKWEGWSFLEPKVKPYNGKFSLGENNEEK